METDVKTIRMITTVGSVEADTIDEVVSFRRINRCLLANCVRNVLTTFPPTCVYQPCVVLAYD